MTAQVEQQRGRTSAPVDSEASAASDAVTFTPPPSIVRRGFLFVIAAVLGYSLLPVWTNLLLDTGMQPFDIGFWRFAFAAPIFWMVSLVLARRPAPGQTHAEPLPTMPIVPLLLLGLLYAASALAAFFGLDRIPAGTYSVIFYTYPALVALIGLLLGERLSLIGWAAILLTLVGVALSAPDFSEGLSGENFTGVLLALTNAGTVAIYFIVSGRVLRGRITGLRATARAIAWTMTGTLLFLTLTGAAVGIRPPTDPLQIVYLGGLTLFSTVFPIVCINMGIQTAGATRAAVFGTFEPLLTAIMAQIFLSQAILPIQWLGGAVVVVSMILLQTAGSRQRTA